MFQRGRAVQALYHTVLNLFFPSRCVVCHKVGDLLCAPCRAQIVKIPPPLCPRCGRPLVNEMCYPCNVFPLRIDGLRAVGFFEGGLRQAIHQFKYRSRPELALSLAPLLLEHLREHPLLVDALIPVPLHAEREGGRGYNQSLLLARELAALSSLPLWYNKIKRVRATAPQVHLGLLERRENVREAFRADDVSGARILLIDDVCTTGATLDACAVALKERGAKWVWGLALARGR